MTMARHAAGRRARDVLRVTMTRVFRCRGVRLDEQRTSACGRCPARPAVPCGGVEQIARPPRVRRFTKWFYRNS
ncbi:hypothetical protein [Burkholderia pseudomallei]|uniref:hypothetical protein n=1 Tax=Burkholderia pseudomallei TaxID=28450 RepID=UPI0009784498|nr:hypothetical protein [Burkholderia pseudomallei]